MDRDFLTDLFYEFGEVNVRRMFSGYGISVDGVNFAFALRGSLYFRVDEQNIARFQHEGSEPFKYATRAKEVTVASYWQLPERLFDEPEELAQWAYAALAAARRAAVGKPAKASKRRVRKAEVRKTEVRKTEAGKSGVVRAKGSKNKASNPAASARRNKTATKRAT